MPLLVIRTNTSVGSWIFASSTSSHRMSPRPCQVIAFMSVFGWPVELASGVVFGNGGTSTPRTKPAIEFKLPKRAQVAPRGIGALGLPRRIKNPHGAPPPPRSGQNRTGRPRMAARRHCPSPPPIKDDLSVQRLRQRLRQRLVQLNRALPAAVFSLLATTVVAGDAVLVEFHSPGCGPCRAMQPVVSELIARGVPVRQVDVSAERPIAARYRITSTPTYVILREGREVTRLSGMQSIEALRTALNRRAGGPLRTTGAHTAPLSHAPAGRRAAPNTRLAPLGSQQPWQSDTPVIRRDIAQPSRRFDQVQAAAATTASGEPMPSREHAEAIERARAATVRLRVHDSDGFGVGTGTIIDTHDDEALVLTCGHLFRETGRQGRIEVDVFAGGQTHTVPGTLIDYEDGDRDIALVAIRPPVAVEPVAVIGDQTVRTGDTAFSFGCDRGADPTRRDTRITGVNKYNQKEGGSNLEIAGAPIDGRSGGGLFDAAGTLIGVCNAADFEGDVGIYTGPGNVHWQLDRVSLSRLYQNAHPQNAHPAEALVSQPAPATSLAANFAAPPGASELIVIVRGIDGSANQTLTLSNPDARLVQQIQAAARR